MRDIYESLLKYQGCFMLLSSMIWIFHGNEKWFSRLLGAVICAGFLHVGECIRENKK